MADEGARVDVRALAAGLELGGDGLALRVVGLVVASQAVEHQPELPQRHAPVVAAELTVAELALEVLPRRHVRPPALDVAHELGEERGRGGVVEGAGGATGHRQLDVQRAAAALGVVAELAPQLGGLPVRAANGLVHVDAAGADLAAVACALHLHVEVQVAGALGSRGLGVHQSDGALGAGPGWVLAMGAGV